LSSVSAQGAFRVADVVLLRVGAGVPSARIAAPYPARSTTVVPEVRSTRPLAALMVAVPVASGGGNGVVPPLPLAIWTR